MLRLIVFLSTQFMFIEVMASENIKPQNRGIASTAHPLATQAAADIYRQGGNSVDAAITVSFVLSVVEPTMCGLRGRAQRSEGHTSELQSLLRNSSAVFCL